MPLPNLALVFVPSFLRCPLDDPSLMLTNQPFEQKFVHVLVELGASEAFDDDPPLVAAEAKEDTAAAAPPDK